MINNKPWAALLSLTAIFCSCHKKLLQQIKQEEHLSSYASITADSNFFDTNSYWLEKPDIQFLYSSLFGLDWNSAYLKDSNACKIFITQPAIIWGQKIDQPLIIYPGDSLTVRQAEYGNAEFVSTNRKRTNELYCFDKLTKLIDANMYPEYNQTRMDASQATSSILIYDSMVNLQLKRVEDFSKTKIDSLAELLKVSADFRKMMVNYLHARIFQARIGYFWITKRTIPQGEVAEKRLAGVIAYANTIQSHAELMYYYTSIADLLNLLAFSRNQDGLTDLASLQSWIDMIKINFHGLVKDYLIAYTLYKALNNKAISSKTCKIYANHECSDKKYRLVLNRIFSNATKMQDYAESENGKFLLPFDKKQPVSENEVLDQYKGKVVFVDFWASWCIPCRRELPRVHEIKRRYLGKDIVFLTISIDKKNSEWQKAGAAEKLEEKSSFIMKNNDSIFMFRGQLIETIPRYMIFDKNGILVAADAPHPGDPLLKELIDKYLLLPSSKKETQ